MTEVKEHTMKTHVAGDEAMWHHCPVLVAGLHSVHDVAGNAAMTRGPSQLLAPRDSAIDHCVRLWRSRGMARRVQAQGIGRSG